MASRDLPSRLPDSVEALLTQGVFWRLAARQPRLWLVEKGIQYLNVLCRERMVFSAEGCLLIIRKGHFYALMLCVAAEEYCRRKRCDKA